MSAFTKINTEWKFDKLLPKESQEEIDVELKKVEEANIAFSRKWKENTKFLHEAEVLKEALDEYEALTKNYSIAGKALLYIHLKTSIDSESAELKAKNNKIEDFARKMINEVQFFTLNLAKVSEVKQKEFLENNLLKEYKHYLHKLFESSKYVLSEAEEKILNLKGSVSHSNWTRMTSQFLSKEERKVLNDQGELELMSFSKISGRIDNKDKKIRDSAVEALNDIFKKYIEVGEHEINSVIANKKIDDQLRGFERPDKSRHLNDDLDTEVIDALVEAVSSRFDIGRKFYELKAKLFGFDKLAFHERNLTYGELDKEYTYDEGLELVYRVLNNLDPEFSNILKSFNDQSQIDVYPKKGKRSGAFCTIDMLTTPTYILLNHSNKLNDVLTLAHETGHGINHEMMKKQNALNYSLPISTAEVASTFFEDAVFGELAKGTDEEMKLALMMMKLNDDISSVIRQIAFYKVETELHKEYREKGYISKERIGEIYLNNMKAYMGDYVNYDEGCENWWLYVSRFRYFFYVYAYSSGQLISKAMQNEVKKDSIFISKVKEFLSAGASDSPKNIFAKLGIDITDKTFWDKGMDEVEALLKETEELARKLGKI